MLWVDKHRPLALDKLDYHRDMAAQLERLVRGAGARESGEGGGACVDAAHGTTVGRGAGCHG
jgi:hypothetical protein